MKKIIQLLIILILLVILAGVTIFFFNPGGLRDKFLGSMINNYLNDNLSNYQALEPGTSSNYDHPYLNTDQEQMLSNLGVDVSQLPTTITPEMESCAVGKLGQDRINEIIGGATPSPIDIYKIKDCL